jgi:hypothetical protein
MTVPSSTSNSNDRLPDGAWGKIWLLGLGLTLFIVVLVEGFWRTKGHVPSVNDDADLWMVVRNSIEPDDKEEVVLLGASRIQQGINLDVFAQSFGGRKPVQLAVGGTSCVPVLDHLSRDETFRGIAICDIIPFLFYPEGFSTERGPAAENIHQYEKKIGSGKKFNLVLLERRLRTLVQQNFDFRSPNLVPTFDNIRGWTEKGELPKPSGRVMFGDRSQKSDYRSLDQATLDKTKQLWADRIRHFGYGPSAGELREGVDSLEEMVLRIQNRGGQVIFVAFPASGIVHAMEEERQPREKYWDVLAAGTSAIMIHFADYPELASVECLEGSHLDYRDAERFTRSFVTILKEQLRQKMGWK